jgi:hypothetical protein
MIGAELLVRWKRGHQAFHVQLAAINTVIESALDAAQARNQAALVRSLRHLCQLYDAATANMLYTADFPSELYDTLLRPSMAPPFVSPGFSGTLNTEHTVMVAGLRQLGQEMTDWLGSSPAEWPPELAKAWRALLQARTRNQRHHMLVCKRFVPDGVSLLRDFYTRQTSVTIAEE